MPIKRSLSQSAMVSAKSSITRKRTSSINHKFSEICSAVRKSSAKISLGELTIPNDMSYRTIADIVQTERNDHAAQESWRTDWKSVYIVSLVTLIGAIHMNSLAIWQYLLIVRDTTIHISFASFRSTRVQAIRCTADLDPLALWVVRFPHR